MKANELRIGNYFYTIDRGGKVHLPVDILFTVYRISPFEVSSYKSDKFLYEVTDFVDFKITDISPIPLNESWLLKFGFVNNGYKDDSDKYWYLSDYWSNVNNIYHYKNGSLAIINYYPEGMNIINNNDIEYVHSLQNIYFALTGTELTISDQ